MWRTVTKFGVVKFGVVAAIFVVASGSLLWLSFSRPAAAQASISVTDLGTLPGGSTSQALAINGSGQIVGYSNTTDGSYYATLWQNGTVTDLGTLPGGAGCLEFCSQAYAINDAGQIVGSSGGANSGAFEWQSGVMTDLGALPGSSNCGATGINGSGQIVGECYFSAAVYGLTEPHAVLWQNGMVTDLGLLTGSDRCQATGINQTGQIVGMCGFVFNASGRFQAHPVLWQNGAITDLSTLPGGRFGWAYAINDAGQIVGKSVSIPDPSQNPVLGDAWLYQNGAVTDLGTLPGGTSSSANAINNAGQIVGCSPSGSLAGACGGSSADHAVLWQNGAITDLGTLPGGSGADAYGINGSDQVVGFSDGTGFYQHATLWTITQAANVITFPAPANQIFGNSPFTVSASASSGLAVSFSVSGGDPCTISGATVTITGVGTCHVTASQGGDSNYAAATPVTQNVLISPKPTKTVATLAPTTLQYSDRITSFTASVSPTSVKGHALTGSVEFFLNGVSLGTALVDGSGAASLGTSPQVFLAPSTTAYKAKAVFTPAGDNPYFAGSNQQVSLTVTKEDASDTYTGSLDLVSSSATDTSMVVPISATISDSPDGAAGDIRNATVNIVNRDANNAVLPGCANLSPSLPNPSDTTMGVVSCSPTLSMNSSGATQYTLGIVIGGYYTRNSSTDDVVINVTRPVARQFLQGGGTLSVGGSTVNVGYNALYFTNGTAPKGHVDLVLRSGGHVYQVTSNSITSATGNAAAGTGSITASATIADITNPASRAVVDGSATVMIAMTDNHNPATDTLGGTVTRSDSSTFFTTGGQQALASGSLTVWFAPIVTATIPVGGAPTGGDVDAYTRTVYVNNGSGTLAVIDGRTNTVTAAIPIGSSDGEVRANPSTNTIYACSRTTNQVFVIDGRTNTVTTTLSIATEPTYLAVDPAANTIYVADRLSNAVSVIDGATNTVTATIPTGGSLTAGVAIDPNTHTLYVADQVNRIVSVIDTKTRTITATIPVGRSPIGVAADPDTDTIYVANSEDGTVSVIDGRTNTVTATIATGAADGALAMDPNTDTVYTANALSGTVSVIDGRTDTVTNTISVGHSPSGVGVDPNTDTAYVTNAGDGTISVISGR